MEVYNHDVRRTEAVLGVVSFLVTLDETNALGRLTMAINDTRNELEAQFCKTVHVMHISHEFSAEVYTAMVVFE